MREILLALSILVLGSGCTLNNTKVNIDSGLMPEMSGKETPGIDVSIVFVNNDADTTSIKDAIKGSLRP